MSASYDAGSPAGKSLDAPRDPELLFCPHHGPVAIAMYMPGCQYMISFCPLDGHTSNPPLGRILAAKWEKSAEHAAALQGLCEGEARFAAASALIRSIGGEP